MSLQDHKITPEQIAAKGMVAAPDKLTGTAAENKAIFDRLIREAVKSDLNGLIDALEASTAAEDIGAKDADGNDSTVQDVLESLAEGRVKVFTLSSMTDYETAKDIYDFRKSGGCPIVQYDTRYYIFYIRTLPEGEYSDSYCRIKQANINPYTSNSTTYISNDDVITFYIRRDTETVRYIGYSTALNVRVLDANRDYSEPYTPLYPGSPATKKYVDDSVSSKYVKPETGIPEADLTSTVQEKLNAKGIKWATQYDTSAQTIYDWVSQGYSVFVKSGDYTLICEYAVRSILVQSQYEVRFVGDGRSINVTNSSWGDMKNYFEKESDKVTSLSASSTDTQYPSAKAVYGALQGKMDKVNPTGSGYMTIGTRDDLYEKGDTSFTVGDHCVASEQYSVAIGHYTAASGLGSLAVGAYGHASGNFSVALGSRISGERDIEASGDCSFANGSSNLASGHYSHAEGYITTASGSISHSEGRDTVASGSMAHAEGLATKAAKPAQHVSGIANVEDTGSIIGSHYPAALGNYVEIVGNGAIDNAGTVTKRSNARTLDWDGNERLHGDIYVGCGDDSTGGVKLARIPAAPTTDGSYVLKATVSNGVITYNWETE